MMMSGVTAADNPMKGPVKAFEQASTTIGNTIELAFLTGILFSLCFGSFLSFITRAMQIIKFLGLIWLMNIQYDDMLKKFFMGIAYTGVSEGSFLPFPTQRPMNSQLENSRAGAYKGKLTEEKRLPWIL